MKRWHDDYFISLREWKKHHRSHVEHNIEYGPVGRDPWDVKCPCDKQIGRFRKKDAYDCGNARCYICHSDKLPKRCLTAQEINSLISFKEQLDDGDY